MYSIPYLLFFFKEFLNILVINQHFFRWKSSLVSGDCISYSDRVFYLLMEKATKPETYKTPQKIKYFIFYQNDFDNKKRKNYYYYFQEIYENFKS